VSTHREGAGQAAIFRRAPAVEGEASYARSSRARRRKRPVCGGMLRAGMVGASTPTSPLTDVRFESFFMMNRSAAERGPSADAPAEEF